MEHHHSTEKLPSWWNQEPSSWRNTYDMEEKLRTITYMEKPP
jgi:hypothetical protein